MMAGVQRKVLQIALVTETYPPEINGVANSLRNLVAGLQRREHRIHLVRPRQRKEHPESSNGARCDTLVPGLPIPGYRGLRFGLPAYWRLRRAWRDVRPDVVYIATQGPLGHAALATARNAGVPALTGFHTQFHEYSRHYGLGLLSRWILLMLRRFHNRSGATLVPTETLRAELASRGFKNVHVLSRGVDTELFTPRRRSAELRRSWGCGPGNRVVLYIGRLAPEKNLGLALDAYRDIAMRHPDARLVIVGDGPQLDPLSQSQPDLLLTGAKVGEELATHYASGDLFLFPSLTETFGNVVPEAMASGLPVVAFDYGAAGVCIRNWHNGIKVPKGDTATFREAAMALCGNRSALRELGESARATAEGMSWDGIAGDLEEQLFEVIAHHQAEHRCAS